ncbi:MAG: hypothetical protein KC466_20375, partial [Myxococcales bacterium]|nr:hypothetical protein [Myxococcales bacterium]
MKLFGFGRPRTAPIPPMAGAAAVDAPRAPSGGFMRRAVGSVGGWMRSVARRTRGWLDRARGAVGGAVVARVARPFEAPAVSFAKAPGGGFERTENLMNDIDPKTVVEADAGLEDSVAPDTEGVSIDGMGVDVDADGESPDAFGVEVDVDGGTLDADDGIDARSEDAPDEGGDEDLSGD